MRSMLRSAWTAEQVRFPTSGLVRSTLLGDHPREPDSPGDRTARIYVALREAILDGRLARGDRVPATRDLALGVARGTVTSAYDRLVAEGFLESRTGSGTFVTEVALTTGAEDHARRAGPRRSAARDVAGPGP